LAKLHKGTEVVRSGNLDYAITVAHEDEIGALSHAFNHMTASLKEVTVSKSDLEKEMVERKRAEEALRKAHDELEMRVQERTAELARANETLRDLSARLLSAQEDERKRIAADLHDTIGSCLTGVKFQVESALQKIGKAPENAHQPLSSILPMVHEAVLECRRIQMDLRPSMIDDLGLLPTISWFCRIFNQTYPGIRTEQEIDIAEGDIPEPLKIAIYRVTQEAMNNIAKHSKADLIRFSLRKQDARLELAIHDNGRGFSLEEMHSRKGTVKGLGLTSMKERAELSGGSLDIESSQGEGTYIRAYWPLCEKG
jgi:signal transduction histidine kinase